MKIKIEEAARKLKNWSLYRLAERMSLPQQTIYSWANGRTQPSYTNMERLANILNCTLNDLFEVEPDITVTPSFKEPY